MSRTTTYAYDLSGNIVNKAMGNGVSEGRTHDGRNRVSTLQNVPVGGGSSYLSAYGYQYDVTGNVRQVAETYPGGSLAGRTITNTYDGMYRLINESIATSGGGTVATAYTYDKGNNRVSQVVSGGSSPGTTSYTIGNGGNGGAANQVLSATLPDSSVVGFSYDANGNRTQRAYGGHTDVYSYDYEDRLVGLNYQTGGSGTGMYDYSYDYRTRRVARTEPATGTTQIVFDGGTSIEEFGVSGPDLPGVEYLRGHNYGGGVGGLEYSVRSGSANFNQYDSRGDMVAQTNSSGAITFQTAYEAYGEQTVTSGSTADRQKANTKENDPTALLNEGFRYRDLQTGTFITRDPLGFKAGPNMYTYVRQNPWTKFDPEGLQDGTPPPPAPPPSLATPSPTSNPKDKHDRIYYSDTEAPKPGIPPPSGPQSFKNAAENEASQEGGNAVPIKDPADLKSQASRDVPRSHDKVELFTHGGEQTQRDQSQKVIYSTYGSNMKGQIIPLDTIKTVAMTVKKGGVLILAGCDTALTPAVQKDLKRIAQETGVEIIAYNGFATYSGANPNTHLERTNQWSTKQPFATPPPTSPSGIELDTPPPLPGYTPAPPPIMR